MYCKKGKSSFFGNKKVDQHSGANFKKPVFCRNLLQISCFLKLFCSKNTENDYFGVFGVRSTQTLVEIYLIQEDPGLIDKQLALALDVIHKGLFIYYVTHLLQMLVNVYLTYKTFPFDEA